MQADGRVTVCVCLCVCVCPRSQLRIICMAEKENEGLRVKVGGQGFEHIKGSFHPNCNLANHYIQFDSQGVFLEKFNKKNYFKKCKCNIKIFFVRQNALKGAYHIK